MRTMADEWHTLLLFRFLGSQSITIRPKSTYFFPGLTHWEAFKPKHLDVLVGVPIVTRLMARDKCLPGFLRKGC